MRLLNPKMLIRANMDLIPMISKVCLTASCLNPSSQCGELSHPGGPWLQVLYDITYTKSFLAWDAVAIHW